MTLLNSYVNGDLHVNPDPKLSNSPAAPLRLLFAVALLALYACFAAWLAVRLHSWPYGAIAIVAAAASVATALLKPWSRFLVYLLTVGFAAAWGYSIVVTYRVGLFRLLSPAQLVRSLLPDVVMLALMCYCCYAVHVNFRRQR